jgi:hypothetical protein
MTEHIPDDNGDGAEQEAVEHYSVRTLVLGLQTVGLANEFYRISVTSEPPDPRFMGRLYDTVKTGLCTAMFGELNPEALFDAENYKQAIQITHDIATAGLTLTEYDFPPLRIRLDADLAVHARAILVDSVSASPQQQLF